MLPSTNFLKPCNLMLSYENELGLDYDKNFVHFLLILFTKKC